MRIKSGLVVVSAILLLGGCATQGGGGGASSYGGGAGAGVVSSGSGVKIVKPATTADVRSPVEVCMETSGYTVEPAKNGVNEGKGHHHLVIDSPLPDLTKPIPKDDKHVHMGDGSKCKSLTLGKGIHTITAVFAKGNHVPYNPPVTHSVIIKVY